MKTMRPVQKKKKKKSSSKKRESSPHQARLDGNPSRRDKILRKREVKARIFIKL